MEKHLHIVCLDVPYPVNYGGVFDLFYKLQYLKENGVLIHLHCFEHGRGEQEILLHYCKTVHYYRRVKGWRSFSWNIPYIVNSRSDARLLENLSKDNYPVLLEGIHCTLLLYQNKLANRKVLLRLHNVEFEYYAQLAEKTADLFKRIYYGFESCLLKRYEQAVSRKAHVILTVTQKDADTYKTLFAANDIHHLPVFIPWIKVLSKEGKGSYCLYQGNLSVPENETAVLWLIKKVFAGLEIPLVIAGKNPSKKIINEIAQHHHITLAINPSVEKMEELIRDAQVNLLPSFSTTGIKLKLLHAVFCGRHCITNLAMVDGTSLETACYIAEGEKDFQCIIKNIFAQPFTKEQIELRQSLIYLHFNNKKSIDQMIHQIWN